MQILGISLILVVIGLYVLWLRFQRHQEAAVVGASGVQEATVVIKGAYQPNVITVQAGKPVALTFDRQEDVECSRFVTIDGLKIRQDLPAHQKTTLHFTPDKPGEYSFTCDMGMYQGRLIVE
ncbi:MAG: cupredoxin domain-containing protein [bacterium]|nr:cupredoxin domain-containing protein [bacterium]